MSQTPTEALHTAPTFLVVWYTTPLLQKSAEHPRPSSTTVVDTVSDLVREFPQAFEEKTVIAPDAPSVEVAVAFNTEEAVVPDHPVGLVHW